VSPFALVTGKGAGVVVITATSNGNKSFTATCTVTVNANTTPGTITGFVWPVPNLHVLSSGWGHRHTIGDYHYGVDIPFSEGNKVYAMAAGTVFEAGLFDTAGFRATIRHITSSGTYSTVYQHLQEFKGNVLAKYKTPANTYTVVQGELVGLSGHTGTGGLEFDKDVPKEKQHVDAHLHFEIWKGTARSSTINPVPWYHKTDNRFLGTYADNLVYENLVGNNPNPIYYFNKSTAKYEFNTGFKWNFSGIDSSWYTI
jgi:murein DD-endopeptidase MepM/ murein hydrolase activator NlpD